MAGNDTQALDHPLATAIGPHGPGAPEGLLPDVCAEYEAETGRKVIEDFPEWEPCHNIILSNGICGFENIGGDIDKVTGKRVTFAAFPWRWKRRWLHRSSGRDCGPHGSFRIETGSAE